MSLSSTAWLITGASSGLGLAFALAALRAGHDVIGTTRNAQKAAGQHPEYAKLGGHWLETDVSAPLSQKAIENVITEYESHHSNPLAVRWIVISNAGGLLSGVVEDMSEQQITAHLQTTWFGTIRVLKAMIPTLRRNGKGVIMFMSSGYAITPPPGAMIYGAAKRAGEAVFEAYAGLLAPFGIKSVILQTGFMRTNVAIASELSDGGVNEAYSDVIGAWNGFVDVVKENQGLMIGDPAKAAERVLETVENKGMGKDMLESGTKDEKGEGKVLRVLLGKDIIDIWQSKMKESSDVFEAMGEIGASVGFAD